MKQMNAEEYGPAAVRGKQPVQERSRETRRRILQSAKELFTDVGFEETTTHLIADGARVSVGGLYAHFPNKEEIFLTIMEERSHAIYEMTKNCIQTIREQKMEPDTAIDYLLTTMYTTHTTYGKLNREMQRFATVNEEAARIHDRWEMEEAKEIIVWLEEIREKLAVDDIPVAIIIISRATHELFHFLYKYQGQVDEQRILTELQVMFKRYLFG
ncbi:MAG: TetR/AcrR family transcriptional regulator [Deltaproteobacteria bacterium]|nr:TetR/AcrR family transcriptional regulator [Candidatus Zymogenaceae bacterium]